MPKAELQWGEPPRDGATERWLPLAPQLDLAETTILPPGRSAFSEWLHVAWPTVSMTASTRSGNRLPDSNTWSAPSSRARARLDSLLLVTHIRNPPARPSRKVQANPIRVA